MNFRELIESKGITPNQLADAIGCSRTNVKLWVLGDSFPKPESVKKIVKGFAVMGIEVTHEEVFRSLLYTRREKMWGPNAVK